MCVRVVVAVLAGLLWGCAPQTLPPSGVQVPDAGPPAPLDVPPGFDMTGVDHTLVVLPDTQNYLRPESNEDAPPQGIGRMALQVDFVVTHARALKVAMVLHEGDVTQWNMDWEWSHAARLLTQLDEVVPYVLVAGNHDLGPEGYAENRRSQLDAYFPVDHFSARPWFGGVLNPGSIQNAWFDIAAGSTRYLVLALEFGPSAETLDWVDTVLRDHPDHTAVVLTHAHLNTDGTHLGPAAPESACRYPFAARPGATCHDGAAVRNRLGEHPNVRMVLSGHMFGSAARVSNGAAGNPVFELLANYQHLPRGGDGWMRLMFVMKGGRYIRVRAYSPTRGEFHPGPDENLTLDLWTGSILQEAPVRGERSGPQGD